MSGTLLFTQHLVSNLLTKPEPKPLEFDGFGTVCSANPVEFHGVSATQRCTNQKSATLSQLLSSAEKSEAFSPIALREVKR